MELNTTHNSQVEPTHYSIGQVMIFIFFSARWLHHPFLCLLGRWFRIWHRKFEFEKMTARAILNSKITMANQKIENWVFKRKWDIYAVNDERIPNAVSNLNRTTFHPIFGQKVAQKWSKTGYCRFSTVFWPRRGRNVVRFRFWDQIWNPLVTCSLYNPFLLKFSNLDFLVPPL